MTTNNPNTLPAREAAKALGLASSTLAKLRLNGNGPVYCKLGRRVVYRTEDLEAWLETRVARDTSDADTRLPKTLTGQQPSSPGEGTAHERAITMNDEAMPILEAPHCGLDRSGGRDAQKPTARDRRMSGQAGAKSPERGDVAKGAGCEVGEAPTTTPAEQQAIAEATKAEAVKPNA